MSAAEFRQLQGQPKGRVEGPRAPQAVKGNPMYALGRLPSGVMNKTETRFLDEWIKPLVLTGDVSWWAFEGIKLRLADNTFFTADFAIMAGDGCIDLIDVKGAKHLITDDANVKVKVAAERFPFRFFFAWPMGGTTRHTKGWHLERVGRE
jgi:hypothetical protein